MVAWAIFQNVKTNHFYIYFLQCEVDNQPPTKAGGWGVCHPISNMYVAATLLTKWITDGSLPRGP
jgi:hypothetical protein